LPQTPLQALSRHVSARGALCFAKQSSLFLENLDNVFRVDAHGVAVAVPTAPIDLLMAGQAKRMPYNSLGPHCANTRVICACA